VLFLPQGVRRGVSGVGGNVSECFQQSARITRFEHMAFTDWSFGYCLIAGGGQATSVGRYGIRSVPTNSYTLVGRPVT